jgi:hypothetical protein
VEKPFQKIVKYYASKITAPNPENNLQSKVTLVKGMKKKQAKNKKLNFVTVSNKFYGKVLVGQKIYYEGVKPKKLSDDGKVKFGKHILECFNIKFGCKKFKWIITIKEDSVKKAGGIYKIKTSLDLLSKMDKEFWDRSRDIKNDIVRNFFSLYFPTYFNDTKTEVYVQGTIAKIISKKIISKLSSEDKDAINKFLPDYIASESIKTVNLLKAEAQIESLKDLAKTLKKEIKISHGESWWQNFIKSNILIIQQGYINSLEKINISIGNTKFPDFSLITHDNYLDILEIKKPSTDLLKYDQSRNNYFWDSEMSKAIIQVENYIANISKHADNIRSYLLDNKKINLQVLRPRGIILAGDYDVFDSQKEKDDFRLLSQSLKNITILTYSELLVRLENYIEILDNYRKSM